MQRRNQNNQAQPPPDSLQEMLKLVFNGFNLMGSVLAAPFTSLVLSKIGSRYEHIVTLMLAPIPPMGVAALSLTTHYGSSSQGLIGMGIFYLILMAFTWRYYFHVIYVIMHPDKEALSREDGDSLPFLRKLPKGDKWAMVRFIYEPAFLVAVAGVLTVLHVITPLVGGYLVLGAVALMVKAAFVYYAAWEYLRDILDEYNMTLLLSGSGNLPGGEESMLRVVERALARRPTHIPMGAFKLVQQQAKASLPRELQDLIDDSDRAA